MDKLPNGFLPGDESEAEARRVINESSQGFVLYVTEKVWRSDFIKNIELPAAVTRNRDIPSFKVIPVSPTYNFRDLKSLFLENLGLDLTRFHGFIRQEQECPDQFITRLAGELLRYHSRLIAAPRDHLNISVNTYESMPDEDEDYYFDAVNELRDNIGDGEVWQQLHQGISLAQREVSRRLGRPKLRVNGSKHLTTAFLFGAVFNQFDMAIRQKDDYWEIKGDLTDDALLDEEYLPGPFTDSSLFVELSSGRKAISAGVDQLLIRSDLLAGARLKLRPKNGRIDVTEAVSRSLAHQAYAAIDHAASLRTTESIHLFMAAPQSTVMTLASLFQGMPDVHLYEWTKIGYVKSFMVRGRSG